MEESPHGVDFRTTPLPHGMHMRDESGVAEIRRIKYIAWRRPWDRLIVAFSKATFTLRFSTKRHSKNDNSCHTSKFGHADPGWYLRWGGIPPNSVLNGMSFERSLYLFIVGGGFSREGWYCWGGVAV